MEHVILFPILLLKSEHVLHVLKLSGYWQNNNQINGLLTRLKFYVCPITTYSNKISVFGCFTQSTVLCFGLFPGRIGDKLSFQEKNIAENIQIRRSEAEAQYLLVCPCKK